MHQVWVGVSVAGLTRLGLRVCELPTSWFIWLEIAYIYTPAPHCLEYPDVLNRVVSALQRSPQEDPSRFRLVPASYFYPTLTQKPPDNTTVTSAYSKGHIQASTRPPASYQTNTRYQTSLSKRDKSNDDGGDRRNIPSFSSMRAPIAWGN